MYITYLDGEPKKTNEVWFYLNWTDMTIFNTKRGEEREAKFPFSICPLHWKSCDTTLTHRTHTHPIRVPQYINFLHFPYLERLYRFPPFISCNLIIFFVYIYFPLHTHLFPFFLSCLDATVSSL